MLSGIQSAQPETRSAPIRILLADDHSALRMGLAMVLSREADMSVVGQATGGYEALALYERLQPDVTLMDIRMKGLSGIDATAAIIADHPRAKVIMLTSYDRDEDIYRSLRAGAMSYMVKDTPASDLLETIRKVYRGHRCMSAHVSEKLAQRLTRANLTDRESEILQLITRGLSNKEIGQALSLSLGTVKFHVTNLLTKLGASDRTQAVVLALRHGLADI